jgi:hypothetical protein
METVNVEGRGGGGSIRRVVREVVLINTPTLTPNPKRRSPLTCHL